MDFKEYDDILDIIGYDGFINKYGYFYRVCKKNNKGIKDSHNEWASVFMKEKLNIKDFKLNPTISTLITLSSLNGPAEILIHCFGYVYYSHDMMFYKPIIKLPDPKIAGYKATEEQLDSLFFLMRAQKENTDIPIFLEEDVYSYDGQNDPEYQKVKKIDKK